MSGRRARHGPPSFALVLAVAGCAARQPAPRPAAGQPVTVVQYNVSAHDTLEANPWKGANVAAQIAAVAPDFVTVQECSPQLLPLLPERYELAAAPRSGVTVIYDSAAWILRASEFVLLGNDDDGWGERVALWTSFCRRGGTDCIDVYSTHWCVPIRRPDDACDTARQLAYTRAIVADVARRGGAATVIGGDLNVFDRFEGGPVVQALLDAGLIDLLRAARPAERGVTFVGNTWAPPGRIDYLLAAPPVTVHDAFIDSDRIAAGQGSDHHPVVATIQFGARP